MKKRYLPILLFAIPAFTDAQISLTASMAPPVGSMFLYYDANTPSPAFTFSKSGTSNTWDFTAISPLPIQEDTVFVADPATIPGSSPFPTATHAIWESGETSITMVKVDASSAQFLGALADVLGNGTNYVAIAVPPLTSMNFPYTYGNSTAGNTYFEIFATGAAIGQPTIDSVKLKSTITVNRGILASGNMIIPSGTFPALLEREISTNVDSAWMKGAITGGLWILAPGFPTSVTDSAFYWYSDQSLQKYAHALFDDTGLHDVVFFKSSTVSIHEQNSIAATSIFPNPVNNMLYLNAVAGPSSDYRIHIFDIAGKEVINGAGNMQKINVSQLVPGIYFLHISADNGKATVHRFVKD